jgi:hypothetical protein
MDMSCSRFLNFRGILFIWGIIQNTVLFGQIKPASADSTDKSYFRQRDFGKYFISDIYTPTPQIQAGFGLNLKDYNLSPNRKAFIIPYNETTFGAEFPIFSKVKYHNHQLKYKFAIATPIAARLWFDFSETITAPILNTDYQFAPLEFHYLRNTNRKFLKNYALKFTPFFHESTHIGDELTLYRVKDNFPITRVNVSYEAAELALTLNDPNGSLERNTAWKVGIKTLINPTKGWYSIRSVEGDTTQAVPTKLSTEYYLQLQRQTNKGFLASKKYIRTFSLEVRYRVQFGYPIILDRIDPAKEWEVYPNQERMGLGINAMWGYKFNVVKNARPRLGVYLRHYLGNNPYGQFRNLPYYQFSGVNIFFEN